MTDYIRRMLDNANTWAEKKDAAFDATIDRETPAEVTTEEALDLTQQDAADLRTALGAANAEIRHLRLALKAAGLA